MHMRAFVVGEGVYWYCGTRVRQFEGLETKERGSPSEKGKNQKCFLVTGKKRHSNSGVR